MTRIGLGNMRHQGHGMDEIKHRTTQIDVKKTSPKKPHVEGMTAVGRPRLG